jgi:hypothetical protein
MLLFDLHALRSVLNVVTLLCILVSQTSALVTFSNIRELTNTTRDCREEILKAANPRVEEVGVLEQGPRVLRGNEEDEIEDVSETFRFVVSLVDSFGV